MDDELVWVLRDPAKELRQFTQGPSALDEGCV